MTFVTLAAPAESVMVVQGSEFLTYATRADTPDEALAFLQACREQHPDATHHCWAYRIGGAYRFSDDGEPGGTAGAPILRTIEGQGMDHVVVVVVRYYGGTKLGAGGLVRAYSGATAECLRGGPRLTVRPRVMVSAHVPFEHLSTLHRVLAEHDVDRVGEAYDETGLTVTVRLLETDEAAFRTVLRDATRGTGVVSSTDT